MTHKVELYTDGGCVLPERFGGWGVVVRVDGEDAIDLSGGVTETTNNRMEMTAIIKALEWLDHPCEQVTITSDSQYVINGIKEWIHNWRKYDWMTYAKKPVKNKDLWERMYELVYVEGKKHKAIVWQWVKGHTGHEFNERADALCTAEIKEIFAAMKKETI